MRKNLGEIRLMAGKHDNPASGGCLMEVQSWFGTNGARHTDEGTPCVCPVLRKYGIALNDRMPDDQRQRLVEFIPLLGGTRDGNERRRALLAADRAVRVFAPIALDAAGQGDAAKTLRDCGEIVDAASAERGRAAANAATTTNADAAANAANAADYAADGAYYVADYFAANAAAFAANAAAEAAAWDEAIQLFRDMIAIGAEDRVPPAWSECDEVTVHPGAECSPTVVGVPGA